MADTSITSQIQGTGFAVAFASHMDSTAVSIQVATAFLSFLAVLALLVTLGVSFIRSSDSANRTLFVKNHIAAYFACLLFCLILQCTSSIFSIQWLQDKVVSFGALCTAQGALGHFANVGAAVWITAIAAHIFSVLFLEFEVSKYVMWGAIPLGWIFTGLMTAVGPLLVKGRGRGPFYGVAGLRCGVSPEFELQGLMLGEMIMILAIFSSGALTLFSFLRVRGIICEATPVLPGPVKTTSEGNTKNARDMLAYPVIYGALALPFVVVQYTDFNTDVPAEWKMFGSCVYLMLGLIMALVFSMTRRMLPGLFRKDGTAFSPKADHTKSPQDQAERGVAKTVSFDSVPTVHVATPPPASNRRSVKRPRPLDLAFRNSFDSMYTTREGQHLAPLSSHWSPDTPPLVKQSRMGSIASFLQATSTPLRAQM